MKTLAIAGTFDTKGAEFLYVQQCAERLGVQTLMINTGVFADTGAPSPATPNPAPEQTGSPTADISNRDVAAAAGHDIGVIAAAHDRAAATAALSEGMAKLLPRLYAQGRLDGVLSLGGSGGTAIATAGMRELPLGVPKFMVSTMAAGDVARYVGTSDIVMMPSIVDVAGLNKISRTIYRNAVAAVVGMLNADGIPEDHEQDRPLVATTMFGVTTPCVMAAKERLEEAGYEVLVFHATGTGGRTMESLIDSGAFAGVLDLTTTEWCDEVVGGILAAGPDRCTAAGTTGTPQVVSVGALDMVNYGPPDSVPAEYRERNLYRHNPSVTLMRTTPEELREIGTRIAANLNKGGGKTVVLLPLQGVSALDAEGEAFWDQQADDALFTTLRQQLDPTRIEVRELDLHINDENFARIAADTLIHLMRAAD